MKVELFTLEHIAIAMYLRENAITVFSSNTANFGGAIYGFGDHPISFLDNSTTLFSNNTANYGGAIYS